MAGFSAAVRPHSVVASWAAGASDNRKILQSGSNNACIKSFSTANVRPTPVDRRDYLPSSPLTRENNDIILRHLWRGGLAVQQGEVEEGNRIDAQFPSFN